MPSSTLLLNATVEPESLHSVLTMPEIQAPFASEVDDNYAQYMSVMRSGLVDRKAKVARQLQRLRTAEQHSESARVTRILENLVPDRVPPPGEGMQPSWMRETVRSVPAMRTQLQQLPPAEDIGFMQQVRKEKSIMQGLVRTSDFKNDMLPAEQEWTGNGTGQGSVAPIWDRPSFMLERKDGDIALVPPPQINPVTKAPFRESEGTQDGMKRSAGLVVNTTTGGGASVPLGAAVVTPSFRAPLNDATIVSLEPSSTGGVASVSMPSAAVNSDFRARPEGPAHDPADRPATKVAFILGAANMPATCRYRDDDKQQQIPSADLSGRTSLGALPPTATGTDDSRFRAVEELAARTASLQNALQIESGMSFVGATPALASGQSEATFLKQEALQLALALQQMQLSLIPGLQHAGATPAQEAGAGNEKFDSMVALSQQISHLQQSLSTIAGIPNSGAVPGLPTTLIDDSGLLPHEPTGAGASTTARAGAQPADARLAPEQARISFEQGAVHGAYPFTVGQAPQSATDLVTDSLRTSDKHETVGQKAVQVTTGLAGNASALGVRAPHGVVNQVERTVKDAAVGAFTSGKQLGATLPAATPVPVQTQETLKLNVQTGAAEQGKGYTNKGLGFTSREADIELSDYTLAVPRCFTAPPIATAATPAPTAEIQPLNNNKTKQYNLLGMARAQKTLPTVGNSVVGALDCFIVDDHESDRKKCVRDLLLERRLLGAKKPAAVGQRLQHV